MIRAYDETYLNSARTVFGGMLDFVSNDLEMDLETFFSLFLLSNLSKRFEEGDFRVLAGMSGIELAYAVLEEMKVEYERRDAIPSFERRKEYWLGWALSYYQWYTSLSFREIVRYIPLKEIQGMYDKYHEMDIHHFVDRMNERYHGEKQETNLKILRKRIGLSQNELSRYSGVPLRTVQQYEQRQKNINRAKVEYLVMFSRVLHCNVEDLMEKVS